VGAAGHSSAKGGSFGQELFYGLVSDVALADFHQAGKMEGDAKKEDCGRMVGNSKLTMAQVDKHSLTD
jgi:hypothetical protein